MNKQHPSIELLQKLDIGNLDTSAALFAENFVWHYFNPNLPALEGDYDGVEGLKRFFAILAKTSKGSFAASPVAAYPCGNELVVTHSRNRITIGDDSIELDAVVVWRIVNGKFAEAWDIPAAHQVNRIAPD